MASTAAGGSPAEAGQPELKPRYGRIAALGTSAVVTATAVLGGLGVLPAGGAASHAANRQAGGSTDAAAGASLAAADQRARAPRSTGTDGAAPEDTAPEDTAPEDTAPEDTAPDEVTESAAESPEESDPETLVVPEDSGEGRRVVFDEGTQRVWLVKGDGSVERTYLVSGSIYDNLDPGTYSVFSRDMEAWGIDGSELRYMVRFTTGAEAAIGFHNIPVLDGKKVQTPDELGTPLSHGCIRQQAQDAQALWEFAPLGTTVVVVDTSQDVVDRSDED